MLNSTHVLIFDTVKSIFIPCLRYSSWILIFERFQLCLFVLTDIQQNYLQISSLTFTEIYVYSFTISYSQLSLLQALIFQLFPTFFLTLSLRISHYVRSYRRTFSRQLKIWWKNGFSLIIPYHPLRARATKSCGISLRVFFTRGHQPLNIFRVRKLRLVFPFLPP